jgi:hypothetical protein
MSVLLNVVNADTFKSQFPRNFPYLPVWIYGKSYAKDDIVYNNGVFYSSVVDNNSSDDFTDEYYWVVASGVQKTDYVCDCDIERAFKEASVTFNEGLCGVDEDAQLMFLYLAAFYLAYDLSVAAGGAYGSVNFPATEVKVGSVSEGYYIPKAYLEDPILGFYARNGFGLKYLNMLYPRLVGNVGVVAGWSLP